MSTKVASTKRAREEEALDQSSSSPSKRLKVDQESSFRDPDIPPTPELVPDQLLPDPPVLVDINDVPRHSRLWFNDGDMILWAQNGQEGMLFRLHRKALADAGLEPFCTAIDFPIPQEGTAGEQFLEGVWVNRYEQQNPREVEALLMWIHGRPSTMKKDIVQFPMIKLLLDRAQIHNSEAMRRCALEYLWGTFPTSLNYHHKIPSFIDECYSPDPRVLYQPALLYEVIKLVDQYRIVTILPLLYYYIAQWPIDWITDGLPPWERADGSESDERPLLPTEHLVKILKGRSALIQARRNIVFNFIEPFSTGTRLEHPTEGCPQTKLESGETCFEWLMRVHLYLQKQKFVDKPNALEVFNTAQWVAFRKHLCNSCAKRVLKHLLQGRDEVWERIPGWFGCTSWSGILKEQEEIEDEIHAEIS